MKSSCRASNRALDRRELLGETMLRILGGRCLEPTEEPRRAAHHAMIGVDQPQTEIADMLLRQKDYAAADQEDRADGEREGRRQHEG